MGRNLTAVLLAFLVGPSSKGAESAGTYINLETSPVHPLDLSSNGRTLVVCNLPEARLEVLNWGSGSLPKIVASVPVGLDPTTARFRTEDEVWVVNQLSDSISVVDLKESRVVATLATLDAPADVVFAGTPPRAYVSCTTTNVLQVFDPVSRLPTALISIQGERPRSLAVSPDGQTVYVAILESGNASTILSSELSELGHPQLGGPADFPDGPFGGINPPPNVGTQFVPPLASNLPSPPRVPLIIKRTAGGRWLDDNRGDWTEFVSGRRAALSGRVPGWDLADHDLALVDTRDHSVRYVHGLMNLCFTLAVNPVSGEIAVGGTDGINEVRFEPRLRGIFHRVKLALVPPDGIAARILDLNPHLTYATHSVPAEVRIRSIGDPRGLVWSRDGQRGYVSGMGSGNIVVIDARGERVGDPISLGEFPGPTGMALSEDGRRLCVFSRFSCTLTVVDTESRTVGGSVPLPDFTPESVQRGRRHFYDTHKTSGLGQAACASCHPDARLDRLAWDLGSPAGTMKPLGEINFPGTDRPTRDFHPMKGPMVTQTLQDLIGHEPFHWRGDREGLEEFNATFTELQGADTELTTDELSELKSFLATISFPPNPLRNFNNSLPTNLPLPGQRSIGRDQLPGGAPLPRGNAQRGLAQFQQPGKCNVCHSLPTGLGSHLRLVNNAFRPMPPGTNGAAHIAMVGVARSGELPFKIAALRSLPDKMGFNLEGVSGVGFGLMHDGSVDSLPRFLNDSFAINLDQDTADLIAFLIAFTGSDLPLGQPNNSDQPPGPPSRDLPAATGHQITLTSLALPSRLSEMISLATSSTGRVDLVVHTATNGLVLGWTYNRSTRLFESDLGSDLVSSTDELRQLARDEFPLTWTLVPRGLGRRLGIDRDEDGFGNRTELAMGTDPTDGSSRPDQLPLVLSAVVPVEEHLELRWRAIPGRQYRVQRREHLGESIWQPFGDVINAAGVESFVTIPVPVSTTEFYRLEVLP